MMMLLPSTISLSGFQKDMAAERTAFIIDKYLFFVINVFDPTNLTSCISHYIVRFSLSSSLHFSKWSPISYSTLLQGRLLKNLFKSLFKFDRYCILKRQTLKAKDWAGVWQYYKMMCKQHSTVQYQKWREKAKKGLFKNEGILRLVSRFSGIPFSMFMVVYLFYKVV